MRRPRYLPFPVGAATLLAMAQPTRATEVVQTVESCSSGYNGTQDGQ